MAALLEAQVRRSDRVALRSNGSELSYQELDAAAEARAGRLQAAGVGPESIVAIALPRSVELVVTLLAVLKAGAAYLPLDLNQPAQRLQWMLAEADPALLVVAGAPQARPFDLAPEKVFTLDGPTPPASARPVVSVRPDHPAYLIFTSGSTGRPKAVLGTQRALVNRLSWGRDQSAGPQVRVAKNCAELHRRFHRTARRAGRR